MKDGRKTPVFHIPGRRKMDEILDNVSPNALFNTVGLYNTGVVSDKADIMSTPFTRLKPTYSGNNLQWDSMNIVHAGFNTDMIGDSSNEELWYHANTSIEVGQYNNDKIYMSSYWESTEIYPRITSCYTGYLYGSIGDNYWQLTDKNVRHHKTPDHATAPAFDDDNIYSLVPYIDQNDINTFMNDISGAFAYPIVEWYLLDAVKEDQDKTIIDKGYTTFREANALFYGFVGNPWQDIERDEVNKDILKIYTPKTLLYSNVEKPDYLKVEYAENYRNWTRLDLNELLEPCNIPQDTWLNTEKVTLGYWTDNFAHISPSLVSSIKHNYKIEQSVNIGPANGFVPNSYTQAFLFDLPDRICINYLFTCNSFTMKGDFDSLHNFNVSGGTNYTITGDPILTYSALKSKKDVHYLNNNKYVFNSLLKRTSINICELNANCFVSPMTFTLSNRGAYAISRNSGLHRNSLDENTVATSIEVYLRYVESDINFGLRHISTQRVYPEVSGVEDDFSGRFYRGDWLKANVPFNSAYVIPFWQSNIIYKFNNFIRKDYQSSNLKVNKWRLLTPEYFGYNPCYSFKYSGKIYLGLSESVCKDCNGKNPFEIIYSNKSFVTDAIDNNQIFLPNNTSTLPNGKGGINSLFENYNKLYALTDDSLWMIPIRPQQIQTDANTAYIGTGEVFSIPPIRLGNSTDNITGSTNRDILKTIHGTFYVNNEYNKIYLLKESPQEISGLMSNFFSKNLEFSFANELRKMTVIDGFVYLINNAFERSFFYYDHRWNKVYFTKIDLKFKDSFLADWNYGTDVYTVVDNQVIVFYKGNDSYVLNMSLLTQDNLIDYKNPATYNINSDIIENNSYTISYNVENNFWESFHSYIPYYAFSTKEGFSTVTNNNYVWKHNTSNEYNYIYLNNVPSIIEYSSVNNKNVPYILESLYVDLKLPLNTNPFSKMSVINNTQSFGYRNILYRAGLFPNPVSSVDIECTSRNNVYMFNNFRANALTNNINKALNYPYIIPQGANTLSLFSQDRIIDKQNKIQLIFNNQRGYHFSLNNIMTIQKEVQI